MKQIIKGIKNALYIIGILAIFGLLTVQFYNWFDGKDGDWYTLVLIIIAFYSLCSMIYKIVKSINYLEDIKNILNSNMKDDTKLSAIDFKLYDVNDLLK